MIELHNQHLQVSIKKKGAEICSIYSKVYELEYIWQADPSFWPWHAPNLFPIVGGVVNDQIVFQGSSYPLSRHGFARHADFVLIESSGTHAIFSLRYSDETLASYPFHFEYQVIYLLDNQSLKCTYKVINLDTGNIYFSLGAHPAFNVPFFSDEHYNDYYLLFDQDNVLSRHHLSDKGYFDGERSEVLLSDKKLKLHEHLFDQDALVFKTLKSKSVTLRSDNNPHAIKIGFSDFKSLGIWAKPGAQFVCIEPWLGYADEEHVNVPFQEKEGIISLSHGHVFEASFTIGIL